MGGETTPIPPQACGVTDSHCSATGGVAPTLPLHTGLVLLPLSNTTAARLVVATVATVLVLVAVSPTVPASPAVAAEGAAWQWPVAGHRILVRPYIAPATQYSAGHRGVDIGAADTAENTTDSELQVLAPADGVVHFAGFVVDRPVLSIRQAEGIITSVEPVTSELVAGERVHRGQPVGILQLGHCARPCLHLGVRVNGEYVSPLNFLGGIPHSVLLPTRRLHT